MPIEKKDVFEVFLDGGVVRINSLPFFSGLKPEYEIFSDHIITERNRLW